MRKTKDNGGQQQLTAKTSSATRLGETSPFGKNSLAGI
jgi:hypothetical protein